MNNPAAKPTPNPAAWRILTRFGRLPTGARLERIKASPNFVDGEFRNQATTPMLTGERGRLAVMWEVFFGPKARRRPPHALPMIRTDLGALAADEDIVVWLGHSSYYLQLGGRRILIDPVFSRFAAPFPIFGRAFDGDYPYSAETMPEIDCLLLSHDHWDHLDYPTLRALRPRIKAVVAPLGVGEHLEYWGFASGLIRELDWFESVSPADAFTVHAVPSRHFSGRGPRANRTLWTGFMLETPRRRIYYSGDSGYGAHFAEIGRRFGGVDLAIMENGQYDRDWAAIHMMPEEVVQAAADVGARAVLPGHAGRFSLSRHDWDDPYRRIAAASRGKDFRLLTPVIGQVVHLENPNETFTPWWEGG